MASFPISEDEKTDTSYIWRRGTGQSPITRAPLPYRAERHTKDSESGSGDYPPAPDFRHWLAMARADMPALLNNLNGSSKQPKYARAAYASAFEEFAGNISVQSQLGASIAEGRESLMMIAQRASQLRNAYKALRKGRFGDFTRSLRVRPLSKDKSKIWSRPKDASAIWLEYWLGWAPLVGDISASIDVLQEPIKPIRIEASSARPVRRKFSKRMSGNGFYLYGYQGDSNGMCYCKLGGEAVVTNPNLYLAQNMGLVNATQIAWELVPFSFIVDWFGNVGSVLGSLSWDAGVSFSQQYSTVYVTEVGQLTGTYKQPSDGSVYDGSITETWSTHAMRRDTTISRPPLVFEIPNKLSASRAATAVSLLISMFTKG